MTCRTDTATCGGPNGLVDTTGYRSLTSGGVALIATVVATGQSARTRVAATPAPSPMVMSGPPGTPLRTLPVPSARCGSCWVTRSR